MDYDPADPRNALTLLAASVRWRVPGFTYRFVVPKIGARGFPSARAAAPFSAIQVAPVCPHVVTPEACRPLPAPPSRVLHHVSPLVRRSEFSGRTRRIRQGKSEGLRFSAFRILASSGILNDFFRNSANNTKARSIVAGEGAPVYIENGSGTSVRE